MFWQRSRQLLSGAAALAALVVLTVSLIALFSSVSQPTTGGPAPTPEGPLLELEGFLTEPAGPFGGRRVPVKVSAPLPQAPDRVPVYKVESALGEPTPELARAWAERLGFGPVRLYTASPALSGAPWFEYIAQAEDGQTLRLNPEQLVYQAETSLVSFLLPSQQPAPDPGIARTAAEDFLKSIPDLVVLEGSPAKVEFRVQPSPYPKPSNIPVISFEVTPLIDGIPLSNQGSGAGMITVGSGGKILSAYFVPLRITPTGEEVTLQPAEAVVRRFLEGDATVLRGSSTGMNPPSADLTQIPQTFYRQPSFTVGESVKTFGSIQHWSAVAGGPDLHILNAWPQSFVLEGAGSESAAAFVEVEGHIAGQAPSGLWRIQIVTLRPTTPDGYGVSNWSGAIRRRDDTVLLETQNGQTLRLPDAPVDLPDGEWVMASGVWVEPGTASARLEWQAISVSPEAGAATPTPVVAAVEKVVVVPVTQLPGASTPITSEIAGPLPTSAALPTIVPPIMEPEVGVFQSLSAVTGGPVSITLPSWWTYEAGEEVTLDGLLSAQGFRLKARPPAPGEALVEDQVQVEAWLLVGDEYVPGDQVVVNLLGEQLTEVILPLDGLHLRVKGRLLGQGEINQRDISAPVSAYGLALDVREYEQVWPEEKKAIYSGPVRLETLEGQEVALFTDTASSLEFVLADSLAPVGMLEMYGAMAERQETLTAIGIIVPDKTFAGRPLLRTREMIPGTGDSESAIESLHQRLENPIRDLGSMDYGPEDVVIDQIELVYGFQTLPPSKPSASPTDFTLPPTELLYRLIGHSSDGQYTLTYDLAATP